MQRKCDRKYSSRAGRTGDGNPSAVEFHNIFCYGKAKPGSFSFLVCGGSTVIPPEDLFRFRGGHPFSVVTYSYLQCGIGDRDGNGSLRIRCSVGKSIENQVLECSCEKCPVKGIGNRLRGSFKADRALFIFRGVEKIDHQLF